jgi:uncharacterized membrane protein (DUF4010 family)
MADGELTLRFGVALAIGLVVGVERGWRERAEPPGSRTAGIRTYGLLGLLGAVAAALGLAFDSALPTAAALVSAGAAFTWFKAREAAAEGSFSVTAVIAALAVLALGALAVAGDAAAAAAGGIALAGLLAARQRLHGLLQRMRWEELRSALLLLAMTVVVLPLLPDRPVDPWGAANPREIWLFTVLTAGVSFAGYLAIRLAGPRRGVLIGGLAGALASSTAVTLAFARRAAAGEGAGLLAGGAALAGVVSLLRVAAIVGVVRPALLAPLGVPVLAAAAVLGAAGVLLLRRGGSGIEPLQPQLGNPLDLGALLLFAVGFAIVALLGGWLLAWLGPGAVLGTSAVFGALDVDVAALSAARSALPPADAADAVLLAMAANAGVRAAAGMLAGPPRFSVRLGLATLAALLSGLAARL